MKFNNRFLFLFIAGILLAALLVGCGSGSGAAPAAGGSSGSTTGGASSVSFAKNVLPILNDRCSSCHGGPTPRAGVDLSSYDSVMNSQVITPSDAQNSRLVIAVESGLMPRSGDPLTADQIQTITNWVNAGAPNN